MNIEPFAVEEWMNEHEVGARFNIAETCVDSVSLDELFALTGEDKAQFLTDFCAKRLTYGDIVGSDALRSGICKLYKTVQPRQVVPTHGAAGANHHVFCSLISAGDRVVSIMPTDQKAGGSNPSRRAKKTRNRKASGLFVCISCCFLPLLFSDPNADPNGSG